MQGQRFKHFQILQLLGRGGMGEVYLALDKTLERKVALKFLPRSLMGDPAAEGRLFDEARSCSRIQHPNVAVVHSIEEDGGVYALCMEYVEGRTLREVLNQYELSLNRVARIGRAIAAGMTAAHEQGVIHRDLKPANVMLTNRGEIKIMDFGLALRAARIVHTAGPNSFGTVNYMSPEQARGETPTALSDIFSFGSTVYELLTGRPPFDGTNDLAILQAIVHEEPTPLRELRRDVPPALDRVVKRCMQKDPGDRFPTMASVAAELQYVEPVVESGPKDLISELATELASRVDGLGSRPVERPRPKPRPVQKRETDGLPAIAPMLTLSLDQLDRPVGSPGPPSGIRPRATHDVTRPAARVRATTSHDTTYSRRIDADFVGPSDRVSPLMPGAESKKLKVARRKRNWRLIPTLLGLLLALAVLGVGVFTLLRAAGVDLGSMAHRLG